MAILEATTKPVKVNYIQLTVDTLDDALEFIDIPRRAVWVRENGFSEYDQGQEGDQIGIIMFSGDYSGPIVHSLIKEFTFIVKDSEGGLILLTPEAFAAKYDTKAPEPKKEVVVETEASNNKNATASNTKKAPVKK